MSLRSHKQQFQQVASKQHALKGQKLLAQGNALGYHVRKQHALKGQKLLAQGNALGYHVRKQHALKGQKP